MNLTEIRLRCFRSYEQATFSGLEGLNVLFGPNASGKTNTLEALHLLCAATSMRGSRLSELVRAGESVARIEGELVDGTRRLPAAMTATPESRTFEVNGKRKRSRDVVGLLPAIAFTPDDLEIAKGSDAARRHEIDIIGSQVNANYRQLVSDFDKILRHKNRLLKDEASIALVEAANVVFAKVASQLTSYRQALFERLISAASERYREIAGATETMTGEYVSSLSSPATHQSAANPADMLDVILHNEMAAHRSLAGPHRDEVHIYIDGLDARKFASQGQQRSIVLALKLAEADAVEELTETTPVLLLDDVMSELDESRRQALVRELLPGRQAFVTTANLEYFDESLLSQAHLIDLSWHI